jgi:serine/threonine-protein kinase PpkA
MRTFARASLLWFAAALVSVQSIAMAADAPRQPKKMEGKQTLFQRVIVRPGAMLYPSPQASGGQPVPGFSVFYVYDRRGEGDDAWVEVGRAADGQTQGWIRGAKLIDWKHTIIAAFTNPAGRGRTLFFRQESDLRSVVQNPNAGQEAARLRADALANRPGPVIALEPENYVDITRNFYLFPVLNAQEMETGQDNPTRLLELISAPADQQRPPQPRQQALENFRAGVVFVVDTTESTQPYIDRTRKAIAEIIKRINSSPMKGNFRFGMVAYRDSLEDTPRLEYTTRVFAKPDFGQPPDAVIAQLSNVRAATVSSQGFDEDPIAGIKAAIEEIDWGQLGGRNIVLITDAGAREANHPHSYTHLGIPEIASMAREHQIWLYAIHLKTPEGRAAHDHDHAAAQYRTLTQTGLSGGGSLYLPVEGGTPEAFDGMVNLLANALLRRASETAGRPVETSPPPQTPEARRIEEQTRVVAEAVRLAYLGRVEETRVPDVVRSFASDSDFADPAVATLKLRVLLTRNQLSDLADSLQTIVREGLAHRIDEQALFGQLRIALATAARDPQRIARATKFADLLGEYLEGLPYHSGLLNISETDWVAMGGIAQREVISTVETKLRLFKEYDAQRDLWVDLSGTHNPGEMVFPVPVDDLP